MNIKKRITMVIIVSLLFLQQMQAASLNDVFDGTSVSTSFGTWDSPRTGSRYFYGGSYAFAFKHSGNYQPFFQGEPPGMKIGCNGFSLSGGFIALLGINEIKSMLKNAGATLAWGLMMGLEYSMPALKNVFDTLRKWAREIQTILENACHLGRIFMKNSPALKGVRDTISNSYVGKVDDWLKTNLKGGMGKIDDRIDSVYQYATNDCAGLADDALKKCENKKSETAKGQQRSIVISSHGSFLNAAAGSHVKNAALSTNTLSISKLSTFLSTGKIKNRVIFSQGNQLETYKTNIVLSRLFFGDKTTLLDTLKNLIMVTDKSSSGIAEEEYKIDGSKLKDFLKAQLTEQITIPKEEGAGMIIHRKLTSAKAAAKAILYGIEEGTCLKDCHDGYADILDNYVYALDFSKGTDNNESYRCIGNVLFNSPAATDTLKVNWDGAFIESLKIVRYIVQQKSGFAPTYKSIGESSVGIKSASASDIKVPLLLPNISKYIQTIVLLEKKAGKETAYTAQLKSILARNNAYFFSTSLMEIIVGNIVASIGSNGDAAGRPQVKELKDYLKFVVDTKDNIVAKINEDQKNQISYKQLTEMFEGIDRKIRQENMKGY